MRNGFCTINLLVALALPGQSPATHHPAAAGQAAVQPQQAVNAAYGDLKWQPIVPDLGPDSPQISILRVDPNTQATQLLIRVPKQMHVPLHWHSATGATIHLTAVAMTC
jgi:hypothetical protein